MAFHFKYFGSVDPDETPDARPLGEWTWDKLPMDKAPYVDWKTGTVRSPLFNSRKPPEIPKAPELDIPDFGDGGGSLPAAEHAGSILYWVPADDTAHPPVPAHWQPMDDAATTTWGSGQILVWDDVQKKWKFSFTPWSGTHDGQILYWHHSDQNWHLSQPLTAAGQLLMWTPGSDHDQPEFVPVDTELQTVVTGLQYDTTTHQVQYKTRQIRALVVPDQAESQFTMITGGQAEVYPPASS